MQMKCLLQLVSEATVTARSKTFGATKHEVLAPTTWNTVSRSV